MKSGMIKEVKVIEPKNKVIYTPDFVRNLKGFKNHHSLKDDLKSLEKELIANPFLGESYGANIYKVRMADTSSNKGKSGGFRVMYYTAIETTKGVDIYMVTIFTKGAMDTIKKSAAVALAEQAINEVMEQPKTL